MSIKKHSGNVFHLAIYVFVFGLLIAGGAYSVTTFISPSQGASTPSMASDMAGTLMDLAIILAGIGVGMFVAGALMHTTGD